VIEDGELLSLSRNQLRIMTGLLKGLSHLQEHIFKPSLLNSPECDRCKRASQFFVAETAYIKIQTPRSSFYETR
jgi:hypothetical protein